MSSRRKSSRIESLPRRTFQDAVESDDDSQPRGRNQREPSRKRKSAKTKAKGKATGSGKLSLLPTMPLDILYEICTHCQPKTLLALTRVNRLFRKALLSKNARPVWREMRKRYNVPEPFGLSEPEWARLLFDSACCQVCGVGGVTRVEFILQRRICYGCIKHNGVSEGRFRSKYWNLDKSILDYVLPSPGQSGSHPTMYFNCQEIDAVHHELLGRFGSTRIMYLEKRKTYLNKLSEHAARCDKWMNHEYVSIKNEEFRLDREARFAAIQTRLLELGYSREDTISVKHVPCVDKDSLLTNRSWAMIKSQVLLKIKRHRTNAFFDSDTTSGSILSIRRETLSRLYTDFKRSLPDIRNWADYPHFRTLCLLPALHDVLVSPDSVAVTEAQLREIVHSDSLQNEIQAYVASLKAHVTKAIDGRNHSVSQRLNAPACSFSPAPPSNVLCGLVPLGGPDSIDLAMTVTSCAICWKRGFSLSDMVRHPCRIATIFGNLPELKEGVGEPVVNAPISLLESGVSLVSASGFQDVAATTVSDMDGLGAFYKCLVCQESPGYVGTWRECIEHLDSHYRKDLVTKWMEVVSNRELGERKDERLCWSCGWCNEHVDAPTTRAGVLEHLHVEHRISEAHVPKDFFCVQSW
ncbi:hypothetical protein E1B28_005664 [Marasmius oreades]|uniref:F-box domain-containing protein n=1 Tax=Marasmius oreades TaxID=181124 RepID=A0A9P7S3M0_9AGAR|nr:uncharacterized protein E1B28_005664 [Marasmius oreades]KAG7094856.1 hypothetical protein E1B28_005664 [Marasmius oreades]